MIAVLTVGLLAGAAAQQQAAKAAAHNQPLEIVAPQQAAAPPPTFQRPYQPEKTTTNKQPVETVAPQHGGTPSAMGLQGYSVVLVVGDMQTAAGGGETVPAAARKALTDMQAFLPYKRYQLLDAAWMVCCGSFRAPLLGRLRGPEERDYSYSIETVSGENGKLTVRFALRDGDGGFSSVTGSARAGGGGQQPVLWDAARAEYSRQLYEAQKERDESEIQQRRAKQMYDVGRMPETEYQVARMRYQRAVTRVQELERTLGTQGTTTVSSARGNLLDSTFSIAIGETVVIGTSRLKGDQALIAVLTAAGKPGAAR